MNDVAEWLASKGVNFTELDVTLAKIKEKESRQNQARAESLLPEVVERYTIAAKAGEKFPPLVGYMSGKGIILIDGNHRHEAYKRAGVNKFKLLLVAEDTTTEQIDLLTVEANRYHGAATDTQWRTRQAVFLLAQGHTPESVAQATGLTEASVRDARRAQRACERAVKLGIFGFQNITTKGQAMLGALTLDGVFIAASEMVADTQLPQERIRILVRDLKELGSEEQQLKHITEFTEARKFELKRKTNAHKKSLSNTRQRVLMALGAITNLDATRIPRDFRTNEERKEVARRAADAALVLMTIEEVLNASLQEEPVN